MKHPVPKPQTMETKVGTHEIPVKGFRKPVLIEFIGGEHRLDAGIYAFWTAVLKKPVGKHRKIWGRARVGLSAGDRFDRMKPTREGGAKYIHPMEQKAYRQMWDMMGSGANIKFIRPSTLKEVQSWMQSHPVQARGLAPQHINRERGQ